jgi:hypothetical protein
MHRPFIMSTLLASFLVLWLSEGAEACFEDWANVFCGRNFFDL